MFYYIFSYDAKNILLWLKLCDINLLLRFVNILFILNSGGIFYDDLWIQLSFKNLIFFINRNIILNTYHCASRNKVYKPWFNTQ